MDLAIGLPGAECYLRAPSRPVAYRDGADFSTYTPEIERRTFVADDESIHNRHLRRARWISNDESINSAAAWFLSYVTGLVR